MIGVLGWIGAFFGICGAILLSLNIPFSSFGYILFSISSVSLMFWAYMDKQKHQLLMQLVFTGINVNGIYQWITLEQIDQVKNLIF
jgi:hypothetical protein